MLSWVGSLEGLTMEATEIVGAGAKVSIGILQRGRLLDSETSVEGRWWQVVTFRNGLVVRSSCLSSATRPSKPPGCRSSSEVALSTKALLRVGSAISRDTSRAISKENVELSRASVEDFLASGSEWEGWIAGAPSSGTPRSNGMHPDLACPAWRHLSG